jgi:hypothetical protein
MPTLRVTIPIQVAALVVAVAGCAAPGPASSVATLPSPCTCDSSAAQSTDSISPSNQIVALNKRVDDLEKLAHPELTRSAEWRELDEVGTETFWQRRFAPEVRDSPWASKVEPALTANLVKDPNVTVRSLECRATLCRLDVTCKDPTNCTPHYGNRDAQSDTNMGAAFCDAHVDKSGAVTKVVFLFRQGRSMVPEGTP